MNEIQDQATRLPDLHKMCLKGLLQRLSEAFGIPASKIVFFSGTDRMKVAQDQAKLAGSTTGVQWPLLLVHVTGVSSGLTAGMHGVNTKALSRKGLYVKATESNSAVRKVGVVASLFEAEVFFMTDTFDSAFEWACQWVANSIHSRLNFTITYAGVGIDIRTEMSDNVATPDKEASVDQPNYFEYSASVKTAGFISDHHKDVDNNIELITVIKAGASLAAMDGTMIPDSTDEHVYSPLHQMEALKEGNVK